MDETEPAAPQRRLTITPKLSLAGYVPDQRLIDRLCPPETGETRKEARDDDREPRKLAGN